MNSAESDEAMLERLTGLSPAEQAEYLKRWRERDPHQLEAWRKLLLAEPIADAEANRATAVGSDDGAARALAFALEAGVDYFPGFQVGNYKLLQKLGEGGFGVVWMAEQQEPIRRCVALKIIKVGMDSDEVITRFEVERQALALMEHTNIARVFDAGTTRGGQPFFAMELVRGVAITHYCDENRLSATARLKLFITVCHAVQHAHQKGVIHRDLKPSNILVTLHDGVAVPKIIDFGIAKATSAQLTDKTLFTQFHAFIGTPAYTSPEQMEMSGLDVDTRSDIYSLGVLLYELLIGQPPFDSDTLLKSGFEAMRRTIRETDPPRPSLRLGTLSEVDRTSIAHQRGTEPRKLSLLVKGDLDWIAMRCLEKDRTRRYDTATALADDIARYLNAETVWARPPSASDRLRKFIRRHRWGVAAGSAVAISLVLGLAVAAVFLVREHAALKRAVAAEAAENGERLRAESARKREAALRVEAEANADQARLAAAKSAQVAQFMTDMLSGVGPSVSLGRDTILLRSILDTTVRRLDAELRDQPLVSADLRDTLGMVYSDLGQFAAAEPLLRAAVEAHRAGTGNSSAATATSLHLLGVVLNRLNEPAAAEAALQEALAIRRLLANGKPSALVADTLYEIAFVPKPERTTAQMRAMLEEVLATRRQVLGEENAAVAQTITGLGWIAQRELNHELGSHLHAQALAMRRRVLGKEHPAVAESLDSLGYSYAHELDRKSDAALAYGEAFAIRRKVLGDAHPKMVVSLLRFAGQLKADQPDLRQLALVREFVASQRKALPSGSVLLAPTFLALASLLDRSGELSAEAVGLTQEARAILNDARGSRTSLDADIIAAMDFFAWSKFVGNASAEGKTMSEETLKLAQSAFGPDSRGTLQPTRTLAWIYLGLGHLEEAVPIFEAALQLDRRLLGEQHVFAALDLAGLAECYNGTSRSAAAHDLLAAALAGSQTAAGKITGGPLAMVAGEFGLTLAKEGRYPEAEDVLRDALARYDRGGIKPLGLRLRPRERAVGGLGEALMGQAKFAEAEPLLLQAFTELKAQESQLAGNRAGMVHAALENLVVLYTKWNRPEKLTEWKEQASEFPGALHESKQP